jgi:hypothetical protein
VEHSQRTTKVRGGAGGTLPGNFQRASRLCVFFVDLLDRLRYVLGCAVQLGGNSPNCKIFTLETENHGLKGQCRENVCQVGSGP